MKTKDNGICVSISHSREIAIDSPLHIEVIVNTSMWNTNYCKVLFNRHMESPSIVRDLSVKYSTDTLKVYSLDISFNQLGNYYFFFVIDLNGVEKALKLDKTKSEVIVTDQWVESPYWKILITHDFQIPDWSRGIVYQLFIDRFNKADDREYPHQPGRSYQIWGHMVNWLRDSSGEFHNNDFFGGNLKGIEAKVPYLHRLGVRILYISPINFSILRYERYAATNHMEIDPDVGTFEDLKSLHETCLSYGIHIVLDMAFNHCHISNPMFQDAISNPDSPYRKWFKWNADGTPSFWFGFTDMPEFDENCKEYQDYIYGPENSVVALFAPFVDGFRLDLACFLIPITLRGVRNRANAFGPHVIYGEWWDRPDISVLGDQIDAPTYYPITNALYKYILYGYCDVLTDELQYMLDNYPQNTLDILLFSADTHDIIRALTILGKSQYMMSDYRRVWDIDQPPTIWHRNGKFYTDEFREFEFNNDELSPEEYEHAVALLKLFSVVQYFLIGNPCLYYGTEAGLFGWKDPFNRKCFPWGHEDQQLLDHFIKLGNFRNIFDSEKSLPRITYIDEHLLTFVRENAKNKVFVAINRSDNESRKLDIPDEFNGCERFSFNVDGDVIHPYGGIVILNK